ncbi:MAG: hypothetical protein ACOYXT_04485 [Bacteroidota bacterium]
MNTGKSHQSNAPLSPLNNRVLSMLREDLKAQKLFRTLSQLGIEDCPYQPDLSTLVLTELGLEDGSDEILSFYYSLIDRHCSKIEPNSDSINAHALAIYKALMHMRVS